MSDALQKRPRDMTKEELEALPIGPFILHRRELTPEDFAAGKRGRWIEWEEHLPIRATAYEANDIFAWPDSKGNRWDFGQWADGSWFKQHSVLG